MIICLTGYKGKNCWKQDCDGSETKTEFKLEIDWDCSGKLTTISKVTDKNGHEYRAEKPELCHGSDCKMPDCPDHDGKICHGISKYFWVPNAKVFFFLCHQNSCKPDREENWGIDIVKTLPKSIKYILQTCCLKLL